MQSFWGQLYNAVIAKGRYLIYLEGLGNTITIALVACAIGLAIGTLIAIVKYYAAIRHGIGWRIGAAICDFYTTVIRGTPIILQLLIIYSITVWTKGDVCLLCGLWHQLRRVCFGDHPQWDQIRRHRADGGGTVAWAFRG